MLSPLDEAVQMRPHLGHLDTTKKQVKEEEDIGEEDKKSSFITVSICWNSLGCYSDISGHCSMLHYSRQFGIQYAILQALRPLRAACLNAQNTFLLQARSACTLQVQVQRRETERQAEQRLASFAHISQTEAEEKWRTLNYASPESEVASGIWEKLMKPTQQDAPLASMPCADYLSTLAAGKAGLPCLKWKKVHSVMAKSVCTIVPDEYPLRQLFLQDENTQDRATGSSCK